MGKNTSRIKETEITDIIGCNPDFLTFLDTSLFIYSEREKGKSINFLDYLFKLPKSSPNFGKQSFLDSLNYLNRIYLPFLGYFSKEKNFYLTPPVVKEIEAHRDGITSFIRYYADSGKKRKLAIKSIGRKRRAGRDVRINHLQNKKDFTPQLVIVLNNYRKTLNGIIGTSKSDERIEYPLENSKIFNLIYTPIQKQAVLLRKEKGERIKGERENKDTDSKTLATAICIAGARNCPTQIITRDSDYPSLLRHSFKEVCRNLNNSGFKKVNTHVNFLHFDQGKKIFTREITEMLWNKFHGKGKNYLTISREEQIIHDSYDFY